MFTSFVTDGWTNERTCWEHDASACQSAVVEVLRISVVVDLQCSNVYICICWYVADSGADPEVQETFDRH